MGTSSIAPRSLDVYRPLAGDGAFTGHSAREASGVAKKWEIGGLERIIRNDDSNPSNDLYAIQLLLPPVNQILKCENGLPSDAIATGLIARFVAAVDEIERPRKATRAGERRGRRHHAPLPRSNTIVHER